MNANMRIGRNIGAAIGMAAFLLFGVVPGFYFGSFGTMVVMSHLAGGPIEGSVIARMAVVVGTMLGLFCTASVSVVIGSVFGTAIGYVTDLATSESKETAKSETSI